MADRVRGDRSPERPRHMVLAEHLGEALGSKPPIQGLVIGGHEVILMSWARCKRPPETSRVHHGSQATHGTRDTLLRAAAFRP